jgi:polysaccharide export outer membrane protein
MMLNRSMSKIIVIGLAILVSACAGSRGGPIPYNVRDFGVADSPKVSPTDDAYKIAPLDVLNISVFQVPDISRDYPVDQSGRISMPLIGRVDAVGLSTTELASSIERRLGEKYLRNPNVTITLKESTSRVVTVDGSVKQPGIFPAIGNLTLMQVVALARGTDEYANPRRVAVFRVIDGKRTAAAFDLTSIRRGTDEDPQIYPGDTVIVDGSTMKKAYRDLLQSLPLVAIFRPF